jgi:hypothetical protein
MSEFKKYYEGHPLERQALVILNKLNNHTLTANQILSSSKNWITKKQGKLS